MTDSADVASQFDRDVGANIRRYREACQMSQADLAERIGVHQQTVQRLEKGTRSLKYAEAFDIASHLRVPIADLAVQDVRATQNALYLATVEQLERNRAQLQDLARRLSAQLYTLALTASMDSANTAQIHHWLRVDWGAELNDALTEELTIHRRRIKKHASTVSYIDALAGIAYEDNPDDSAPDA